MGKKRISPWIDRIISGTTVPNANMTEQGAEGAQPSLRPASSDVALDDQLEQDISSPQPPSAEPVNEASASDNPTEPIIEPKPEQIDLSDEKLLEPKSREKHKLIGQLFDTYWPMEFSEQLFTIDQHAAREEVLCEKIIKPLEEYDYTSQMINPPIVLTLGMNEEILLERHLDYFTGIDFEIGHFGGREYAVRAMPDNLLSIAKKELPMEVVDGLSDDIANHSPDITLEKVAFISCKAAVKGNNRLSVMETSELIGQLLDLENPYTCLHGRPTIISMTKYELEKKFRRII